MTVLRNSKRPVGGIVRDETGEGAGGHVMQGLYISLEEAV